MTQGTPHHFIGEVEGGGGGRGKAYQTHIHVQNA